MLRRLLRWILLLAVVAGLVAGARHVVLRKQSRLAAAPRSTERPLPVRVARVETGSLELTRDYLGVVEPDRLAEVSARLTATVEQVLRDEGDRVAAGEVLAILDSREIRDEIAALEARVEQSRADLAANEATIRALTASAAYWDRERDRDQELARQGVVPADKAEQTSEKAAEVHGNLDAAGHRSEAIRRLIQSLESTLQSQQTRLDYCTLRSPFAGVLARRLVDPGDLASPGRTVMVVEDRTRLKIAFNVPQGDLAWMRPGLEVRFLVGAERRRAPIDVLYPSLDEARMRRAEVRLEGESAAGLHSGEYLSLFVVEKVLQDVAILPTSCLAAAAEGTDPRAFVVQDGVLRSRRVTVLGSADGYAAVSGLEAGTVAVRNTFLSWASLPEGRAVEILR